MQYFLDKLKEFLVFLVFSRLVQLVQGVVGPFQYLPAGTVTVTS